MQNLYTSIYFVKLFQLYPRDSWQSTFLGAMTSGLVIATCMSPFDVVATRIYNQGNYTTNRMLSKSS